MVEVPFAEEPWVKRDCAHVRYSPESSEEPPMKGQEFLRTEGAT
jgi:hypothetical protein